MWLSFCFYDKIKKCLESNMALNQKPKEVLNIIDANAHLFKSYNAYEPFLDKQGKDQRVLKGMMDAIMSIINHAYRPNPYVLNQEEVINHFIFIFDPADASAYRRGMFAHYKLNRPPKEEEFLRQANFAIRVLRERVGIPLIVYPGFEADDAVGSLVHLYKKDYKINVYSIDKDLAQLVDDEVTLIRKIKKKGQPGKFISFGKDDVLQEFGVLPEKIPDLLALVGDTVDNLPGLDQIGPVKAKKILDEYISIDHLIACVEQVKNEGLKNQIREYKDLLKLVKILATIKCDLPIENYFLDACSLAADIRGSANYHDNFKKMEEFLGWENHYRHFFTS